MRANAELRFISIENFAGGVAISNVGTAPRLTHVNAIPRRPATRSPTTVQRLPLTVRDTSLSGRAQPGQPVAVHGDLLSSQLTGLIQNSGGGALACLFSYDASFNILPSACVANACTPTTEVCGNGIDDDCDGQTDEDCAPPMCVDADADGYFAAAGCDTLSIATT